MSDDDFKRLTKADVEQLQMLLDKAQQLYTDCRAELAAANDGYQTFRETLDRQAQLALRNLERQAATDLADKDAAIAEKDAVIAEKDAAIASLIAMHDAAIASLVAAQDAAITTMRAEKDAAVVSLKNEIASLTANADELTSRIAAFEREGLLPSVVAARKSVSIASETKRLADAQATAADAAAKLAQLNKDGDSPIEPIEPAAPTPAADDIALEPLPR